MRTCHLQLPVEYSVRETDPESIATAMDRLLKTALSTPGIVDDYGRVQIGEFTVLPDESIVRHELMALLRSALHYVSAAYDEHPHGSNEHDEALKLGLEIEEALKLYDVGHPHRCQDCGKQWPDSQVVLLEDVKNLLDRVSPGEPTPSGECPECHALCQPVKVK